MITYQSEPDERGYRKLRCSECGAVFNTRNPPERIRHHCGNWKPGVGDYLAEIVSEIGMQATVVECASCASLQSEMNGGGPEWCEQQRSRICQRLYDGYTQLSWEDVYKAGTFLIHQTWFRLPTPFDRMRPYHSMLDEAIRRFKAPRGKIKS